MKNNEELFHLRNRIESSVGPAIVDTATLFNGKFETMMFRIKRGKVDYSSEVDVMITSGIRDAKKAHEDMIQKWKIQ